MVTALIFAGGTGQRIKTVNRPKQFLELHGKPILIYTIELFENHKDVDNIVVVCLEGWIDQLERFLKIYEINKVSKIVCGSDAGGDKSILNGLKEMRDNHNDEDIVLIHDGVRPLITSKLISENIEMVRKKGNAITSSAARESIVESLDGEKINDVPARNKVFIAKAPQSFKFGDIYKLYMDADANSIRCVDASNLCNIYNVEMNLLVSTDYNIKITTAQDYYIFRALYEVKENEQIFGLS